MLAACPHLWPKGAAYQQLKGYPYGGQGMVRVKWQTGIQTYNQTRLLVCLCDPERAT
jgi:hypothetical protein